MNIQAIYHHYQVPTNLQRHMLRVAAVAKTICDHFQASIILNTESIIITSLLHDMGNVLKIDFNDTSLFDAEDLGRIEEYKQTQASLLEKYGSNPDEATLGILRELGISDEAIELCEHSHWEAAETFVESDDWAKKICLHADMRVGPYGLLTLRERFDDLVRRRPEQQQKLDKLFAAGAVIQQQLQDHTNIDITTLDPKNVDELAEQLRTKEVTVSHS